MSNRDHIKIPFRTALVMIGSYAKARIVEQIRSVAFIIVYLVAFQTIILGTAPANAVQVAVGIAMVVAGLAFFLEGLLIGIMPLGERVGVQLPKRTGIVMIALFGVLVGVGSTLAEPAVAALRTFGETVTAWDAPLLFIVLEQNPEALISAIGVGVGIAVALGMVRFYFGISLKPFIYMVIPVLLFVTVWFSFDEALSTVIGLAWDSGAVTTGPVTVPLILALGIGVSRAAGTSEGTATGFGIVMLASALPVLSVLVLGFALNRTAPEPVDEATFFAPERREASLELFENEQALLRHAFKRGTDTGRRAFFESEADYRATVDSLFEDERARREVLGDMTLGYWLDTVASRPEVEHFPVSVRREAARRMGAGRPVGETLLGETGVALRAIVPLTALLLVTLLFFLRNRPRYTDEFILGIVFAIIGMAVLTSGITLGLSPLGDDVGRQLPRAFRSEDERVGQIIIEDFDRDLVVESIDSDGQRYEHFYLQEDGRVERIPFYDDRYDAERDRYEHILSRAPLFGPELTLLGIGLVFLFAFGMGYGSTLAEPALNALGRTVEHLTVGTIKRSGVVTAVSLGVGVGLLAGVGRILYDIPTTWLLIPPYLVLLPLTWMSDEDFAAIAWDSGGVTTGPVTVPLVMAMGLGIGGELDVVDGFGVLALASVFPILSVLIYGLIVSRRQQRTIKAAERENKDG